MSQGKQSLSLTFLGVEKLHYVSCTLCVVALYVRNVRGAFAAGVNVEWILVVASGEEVFQWNHRQADSGSGSCSEMWCGVVC